MDIKNNILKRNISYGLVYKFLTLSLTFLIVPLLIQGLGVENYGVWVTIFSVFGWVYLLDLGIGNGVKNNLTIEMLNKNYIEASQYITTAFVIIAFISFSFFLVFSSLIYIIDLSTLLNINQEEWFLKVIFFITLVFFSINFIFSLYKQLFYSVQKSSYVELSNFLYNALVFIQVYVVSNYFTNSLLKVAIIYGFSNLIIGLVWNLLFFYQQPKLEFKIKNFRKHKIKEITGIGIDFFIIQICLLVILMSDNLIISSLLDPTEVASYNNVYKVFQVYLVVSTVILTPLWTLYTDAFQKKDFNWIINTIKRLNMLFLVLIVAVVLTIYYSEEILFFWIKEKLYYSKYLFLFMGIFVLVRVYGDIYFYFLNGIGKIRLQLILFIIGAVINVPLSILFVTKFHLGNSGVILATIVSLASFVFIMPLQTYFILKKSMEKNEGTFK